MHAWGCSVCVSDSYNTSCCMHALFIHWKQLRCHLQCFKNMHCVHFIENAMIKTSGDINFADHLCLLCFLVSSWSTKETAWASLNDIRCTCRSNDDSYYLTDSHHRSLLTIQLLFLLSFCVFNLLTMWHWCILLQKRMHDCLCIVCMVLLSVLQWIKKNKQKTRHNKTQLSCSCIHFVTE